MTVDQLCALPVGELASENSHCHLWVTNAYLMEAHKILDAWGFEFKSSLVWVKPTLGIGNYWRCSHEILLTAVRGDARRFAVSDLRSWIEAPRARHSQKPDAVRHAIEKASPSPRIELFARARHPGWLSWGNEV